MSEKQLWQHQEDWAEREAQFCDRMVAEYRGHILKGWKDRPDHPDNAIMQAKCLIYAEAWEQMANNLRKPRRCREEQERYASLASGTKEDGVKPAHGHILED